MLISDYYTCRKGKTFRMITKYACLYIFKHCLIRYLYNETCRSCKTNLLQLLGILALLLLALRLLVLLTKNK